jgi:hypothetical protein
MTRVTTQRRVRLPLVLGLMAVLTVAAITPASTGAYWNTTVTAANTTLGVGEWCAAPDPAISGARFIRLSSVTTDIGSNRKMVIVPVANNANWGGGTGSKKLSVRLWGCSETPAADTLRITAWSNPSSALGRTFLAGNTVAPATRLNPNTAASLGVNIRDLAVDTTTIASNVLGFVSGDARRFSWIVSSGRTSAAPTTDPSTCYVLLSGLGECRISMTSGLNGTGTVASTFTQLFNITPWSGTNIAPTTYGARSYATQTPTGWGAATGGSTWLNYTCALGCTTVGADVALTGTASSDATLFGSSDGNLMQWVVITWTGTITPTDDLVVEIVLT